MVRLALLLSFLLAAEAFLAPTTRPALSVSRWAAKKGGEEEEESGKPKLTLQGLVDLMALGAGAPNLGKFTGVDKDTGTLNFELEKNNFKRKDGKVSNSFDNSDGTYFDYGEVDEDADVMGKIGRFFGGGKKD